ncbi:MAG: hypothetical protein AAFQ15_09150 [Pseudomonadota bacterium]
MTSTAYSYPLVSKLPREDADEELTLNYFPREITAKGGQLVQRRLQLRDMLVPDVRVAEDFRCRAVIDYVEVEIDSQYNNFTTRDLIVEKCGESVWVEACAPTISNSRGLYTFAARIQDPDRRQLNELFGSGNSLSAILKPLSRTSLREIEVSVDFFPKDQSDEGRERMVGLLARHYLPSSTMMTDDPNTAMRSLRRTGSYQPRRRSPAVVRIDQTFPALNDRETPIARDPWENNLRVDRTVAIGDRNADAYVNIDNKVTNIRNPSKGTFEDLAPEERRSRIEVTLKRPALEELGLTEVSQLSRFPFQKLREPFFDFRLPTVPVDFETNHLGSMDRWPHERDLINVFLNMGIATYQREQLRHREVQKLARRKASAAGAPEADWPELQLASPSHSTNMVAYADLNSKIFEALRSLSERER